ncbi:MAG: Pili subunit [Candidatus Kaiserbacteria bacterium]|nr:Pili subunit [Candidatus Kaiserbacteria bacterium]
MFKKLKTRKLHRVRNAGFTLIELLAVTAIMMLITGLVLGNNNKFNGTILLQNVAYDIALSVREAQVYGISVQNFNGTFTAPYGMHFQVNGNNTSIYILFADASIVNGTYDSGELVQSTTLSGGYRINDLCATPPSGTEVCGLTSLDVTFVRPEPDAYIRTSAYSGLNSSARIRITSTSGSSRDVVIGANGQISVQQ